MTTEEVPFCGCTNEELEAGRSCGQPTCPNRTAGSTINEAGVKVGDTVLADNGDVYAIARLLPHAVELVAQPGGPVVALADPGRLAWYANDSADSWRGCWRGPTVAPAVLPDPMERRRHQRRQAIMRRSTLEAMGLPDRRQGRERRADHVPTSQEVEAAMTPQQVAFVRGETDDPGEPPRG